MPPKKTIDQAECDKKHSIIVADISCIKKNAFEYEKAAIIMQEDLKHIKETTDSIEEKLDQLPEKFAGKWVEKTITKIFWAVLSFLFISLGTFTTYLVREVFLHIND